MFSLIKTPFLKKDPLLFIYFILFYNYFFDPAEMASQYFEKYVFK